MIKSGLISLTLLFLSGCQKPAPASANESASPRLTAAEVFELRSKCADLGQKIINNNTIGIALSQDQVSHYDSTTNRCYVEVTVQTADLSKAGDYFEQYLYDGQTGEMLASIRNDRRNSKWGMVYDHQHKSPIPVPYDATVLYDDALSYIDSKMADDRKQ